MNDFEKTIAWLAGMGALIAVGACADQPGAALMACGFRTNDLGKRVGYCRGAHLHPVS